MCGGVEKPSRCSREKKSGHGEAAVADKRGLFGPKKTRTQKSQGFGENKTKYYRKKRAHIGQRKGTALTSQGGGSKKKRWGHRIET